MPEHSFKDILHKEMTRKDFLSFSALFIISLIGVGGVISELLSHAATPYASDEVESGTKTGAATEVASSSESGGEAVQFGASPTTTNTSYVATGATASTVFTPSGLSTTVNANNTTAIQNAITAAHNAGGGVVQIPAGTYYLQSHIEMQSNVGLVGSGPGPAAGDGTLTPTTTLKAGSSFYNSQQSAGGYPIVSSNNSTNVTISNFIADGSSNLGYGSEGMGGRLSGYLVEARGGSNTLITYITTLNTCSYQIVAINTTKFTFAKNYVYNATSGDFDQCDGMHILDSNTGQVIYNTVNNRVGSAGDDGLVAHTINAAVHDVEYGWNDVIGGNRGDGMQFAVGDYPIYNIQVHDCNFYNAPTGLRSGAYGNAAQYNITLERLNIHNVVAGVDFPDGSGPPLSVGNFYGCSGAYDITATSIRVYDFNTSVGNTLTNALLNQSNASPCVGIIGAGVTSGTPTKVP